MDASTFLKKLDRIPQLPTLPTVALKLNKMLGDQEASIKELSKMVEHDQAMVSRILRLVNSAFYGSRSTINNIPHAVILLGFNTVRNAIVSVSVIDALSGKQSSEEFDITDFWKHSVAVALTSKNIAERTRLIPTDESFTAGLLHDIGKVVLWQFFPEDFGQVWASVHTDHLSFHEAEKKMLPVTHAEIGGHLAKKWALPDSLVDAITYHHDIIKDVSNLKLLTVVHMADTIVNAWAVDSGITFGFPPVHPEAEEIMTPELKSVTDWFPQVETEIDEACELFLEGGA
jgi:putative nucleotidyltransferase with HDIG domain